MTDHQAGPDSADPPPTRWQLEMDPAARLAYRDRFAEMVGSGADLEGEARLLDAMLPRHAAVLDAGCGTGRITNALRRMGHRVVGVDQDVELVSAAREWYPQSTFLVGDLLRLTPEMLRRVSAPERFDLIALPGNVLVYVAPGTEKAVLANLLGLLADGGRIVTGFSTNRAYRVADLDADAAALGLTLEQRFATWDLEPWSVGASWAVSVLRAPGHNG